MPSGQRVMIGEASQKMSQKRQSLDHDVLVRFWALDHHRAEPIPWPASDWVKLVYSLEGSLMVSSGREVHLLTTNRALLLPAGQRHPARTLGPAKVRSLYFAPSVTLAHRQGIVQVRPFLRELIGEACRAGPLRSSEPLASALALLLVSELASAPSSPTSIPMPRTDWLLAWAESFFEDPSVGPCGLCSRRTLERRMLAETGLTLGQWQSQARALRGLRSLAAGSSVQESALAAGFETASGFIQAFRRQFGTTPGRLLREERVG